MAHDGLADRTVLQFQIIWPQNSILEEFAQDYVDIVNTTSGGRLVLNMLPAGAVCSAAELQRAVSSGMLDGGHTVASNQYGHNKAYSLFTTPPPFGWNSTHMLGWFRHGGGQALYDELVQEIDRLDVVSYFLGPMPTQPFGWFKKPIHSPDDLRGLRYRTNGLSLDVARAMGMEPVFIPAHETAAAIASGEIDGGEFLNPTIDRQFGFAQASKFYMIQGFHQVCECFEVTFNKKKHEALDAGLKTVLRHAADAASANMLYKQMHRFPGDLLAIKQVDGVSVVATPSSILEAQLSAWSQVLNDCCKADPYFEKVVQSQKAWVREVVGFDSEWEVSRERAYKYFYS